MTTPVRPTSRLGRAARVFYDHPRRTLACVLLLTLLLGSQLTRLSIDNSPEQLLHSDDPQIALYEKMRRDFGTGDWLVVALIPGNVLDLDFISTLDRLHGRLEAEVPHLHEITSLIDVRHTYGRGDALVVEELMEKRPRTEADLEEIRAIVDRNPLYENSIISSDRQLTTILIELDTFSNRSDDVLEDLSLHEKREAVAAVESIVADFRTAELPIHVAGGPILETHMLGLVSRDMGIFMGIAITTTITLLWLMHRRLSGALLPLIVVGLSTVSTMGLMGLMEMPLTLITQILPTFLLVIGVADAVHILVVFYRHFDAGLDGRSAIVEAIEHSGRPVLWTSFTTAAGLASFAAAELAPISDLGILGPIGVGFALVYTLILLPALLALTPLRRRTDVVDAEGRVEEFSSLDRLLSGAGTFAVRNPLSTLAVASLIAAIAVLGIARLRFSHDIMSWLPDGDRLKVANETIEAKLGGVMIADFIIDTGVDGGLQEPAFLRAIERFDETRDEVTTNGITVDKVISIADFVMEVNRALSDNDDAAYRIPESREAVAQELLLFESEDPEAVAELADSTYRTTRMRIQIPWADSIRYVPFLEKMESHLGELVGPGVEVGVTGLTGLMARVITALIGSLTRSYMIALAVITPLMCLVFRSYAIGVVSMLPNVLPMVLILGVMGWFDIPLDASNILLGSIVFGVAVDDTIHLILKLRDYRASEGSLQASVARTFLTTGRALAFTSLVLGVGFLAFAFAYVSNVKYFGLLAGGAILLAFLADIFVTPALLAVLERLGIRPA